MTLAALSVLDADGHVTESYQQLAKYLDEPYRRRAQTFPWYTADGWDRRLVDKFHDWAGNADEWQGARRPHRHPEAQDPRRQHAPPLRPQALNLLR